jgi:hypothetical protein
LCQAWFDQRPIHKKNKAADRRKKQLSIDDILLRSSVVGFIAFSCQR